MQRAKFIADLTIDKLYCLIMAHLEVIFYNSIIKSSWWHDIKWHFVCKWKSTTTSFSSMAAKVIVGFYQYNFTKKLGAAFATKWLQYAIKSTMA